MYSRKAFTLIELLVVVLIISILAAIALPQYQTAVAKSRLAQDLITARAITDAQQSHRLITGQYAKDAQDLDVCVLRADYTLCRDAGTWNIYSDGKGQITIGTVSWGVGFYTGSCPSDNQDTLIMVATPGYYSCPAEATFPCFFCGGRTARGKKLCSTYGAYSGPEGGFDYYYIAK